MTWMIDATHDPKLRSWVESANSADRGFPVQFPIQNLPFGVFRTTSATRPSLGVAIGDEILDLRRTRSLGLLDGLASDVVSACEASVLNSLFALGRGAMRSLRARLSYLLSEVGKPTQAQRLLVPRAEAELLLPIAVGDYTDFYASIDHATNVGRLFRPDHPLLPNYRHVPIGYHGRASSLILSPESVRRPCGQSKRPDEDAPRFAPCQQLDYEIEVGFVVGAGNELGTPIQLANAEEHIAGLCLLNDWSARDVQAWEYQPLGPFLSKSFATSLSPWIVTLDGLAPFRTAARSRTEDDPPLLHYLADERDARLGGIDLTVEVFLSSRQMCEENIEAMRVSRGSLRDLYWTIGQMLTHHTSNGCSLSPGDLMATGTVSGPQRSARGCLLEITSRGATPLRLPSGEERRFLEDGDEVVLRAYCERAGFATIGFGECRGRVQPARNGPAKSTGASAAAVGAEARVVSG